MESQPQNSEFRINPKKLSSMSLLICNRSTTTYMTPNSFFLAVSSVTLTKFTFSKKAFDESLDFLTVHSLMKDINLIDSCQAHWPVQ